MPVFKVEIRRIASRVVELRQTSAAYIEARDVIQASEAASVLCSNFDIDEYCEEWRDDDDSRVASNDEVVERAHVDWVYPTTRPSASVTAKEVLNRETTREED